MDKLMLLSGSPYTVNQKIEIKHPTLGDVTRYGENKYLQLVTNLTATSFDFRFLLDDMGEYYEDVDDYTMFCRIAPSFQVEETAVLFGDLDFSMLEPMIRNGEEIVLRDEVNDITIDKVIYELIVDYLRTVHGFERNYKTAGNRAAAHYHLVEERRKLESKAAEYKSENSSVYTPLVSSLVNCADFKYDYTTVWGMPIYTFMDSVRQVNKLVNYKNIMTGIYTGNVDASKIKDKKSLTWIGE